MVEPDHPTPTIHHQTETTARVLVPTTVVSTPPEVNPFNEYGSVVIVVTGLIGIMLFAEKVFAFLKAIAEFFDRRKKTQVELDEPLVKRLENLENTVKRFRTEDEISRDFDDLSKRFEHDRGNRKLVQEGVDNRLKNIENGRSEDRIAISRIETKMEALSAENGRTNDNVDSLRIRIEERFDKLHDILLNGGKRT